MISQVRAHLSRPVISNVRFDGCVMQWNKKWYLGDFVHMNETEYKVDLKSLRAYQGALLMTGSYVRVNTDGDRLEQTNRYWKKEGTRMVERVPSNTSNGNDMLIPLQDKENIPYRVGYALVHAARLCGARTQR